MRYFILFVMVVSIDFLNAQTLDSVVINQVDSLIKISQKLAENKEYQKALEVNTTAENIGLSRLGRESAQYGKSCFNRGTILQLLKKFTEAEKWYIDALEIREKVLGKEHLDYLMSLNALAGLYMSTGKYEDSEFYYIKSKEIREKLSGKLNQDYATLISNLANVYRLKNELVKAEPLFEEALNIRAKLLGKGHPDYAKSLNNLANCYVSLGYYRKAEPLYLEVKDIRLKIFGKYHINYASILHNLGNFYHLLGDFTNAELFYLESLEIKTNLFGNKSPENTITLNNLGVLYFDVGNYRAAEKIYLESLEITALNYGKESPDYATALHSLAGLYTAKGDFSKAESLYLETLRIRKGTIGNEHHDYLTTLNNLAVLYKIKGDYVKAEDIYTNVIELAVKSVGKENREYASYLINLANLYQIKGNLENAEMIYLEALSIKQKILGKEHPENAFALENLSQIYKTKGDLSKTESLLLESKIIREKSLGKEHPEYLNSIYNLADFYSNSQQVQQALIYYLEGNQLNKLLIQKASAYSTESQMVSYLSLFKRKQSIFQSFALDNIQTNLGSELYNNSLFYNGLLIKNYSQIVNQIKNTDSMNLNLFRSWQDSRKLLGLELLKPLSERKFVNELESKAEKYEKQLTLNISSFKQLNQEVTYRDITSKLHAGEAAVEFINFSYAKPEFTDSTIYVALVLISGWDSPKIFPLFEEKILDSLLHSTSDRKADYVNNLYSLTNRGAIAIDAPKKSLYEILWKPLEKELTGIKTVYYSPSGLLHRINLDAIPISDTETLADKYQLIAVNSTRQLVIPDQVKIVNSEAVLYGGILFEQDSILEVKEALLTNRTLGILTFSSVDSSLKGGTWNYLPFTEREVNAIEKTMEAAGVKTNLKKGYQATEESFKNIGANNSPSPRILHIATHGYFFPDPDRMISAAGRMSYDSTASEGPAKAASSKPKVKHGINEPIFKISDHPMLRSGLIMAGGNTAWQGKKTWEGREDGILTAYEISQMNLSNTELVVLSACETGLGDIQGNEGVYGLQRAFKIAGAKYLIMSLWQVPDKQTSLLMTIFYKKWLEDKMTIPDAFHAAQKELREIGLDAYQWAGFVLVE